MKYDCFIGSKVRIGSGTKIQAYAFIPNGVTIGDNCFIGPHVCFTNDKYPPSNGQGWQETIVEDNVSIGAGTVILPGITIKENTRIGAGSLITKDTDGGLWYGSPARRIK